MHTLKLSSLFFAAIILSACARPMIVTPNLDKIGQISTNQQINKNVAYLISSDVLTKEVTTPGGGGDKVTYYPYRDIETGFYKVLSNVFANVTKLKSASDAETISKNNIVFLITPTIVTDSSSPSALTWPPTKFSTELTCRVTDKLGNLILETKVTGNGAAEFDEFKKDLSLSGKRSTEDALIKLQQALLNAPELRK